MLRFLRGRRFTLPSHSPWLNADELARPFVKRKVSGQTTDESKDATRRLISSALGKPQRATETLERLFHEERVAYIIDGSCG